MILDFCESLALAMRSNAPLQDMARRFYARYLSTLIGFNPARQDWKAACPFFALLPTDEHETEYGHKESLISFVSGVVDETYTPLPAGTETLRGLIFAESVADKLRLLTPDAVRRVSPRSQGVIGEATYSLERWPLLTVSGVISITTFYAIGGK